MKKYILELNENQLRCIKNLIWNNNTCNSGCCYEENEDKDIECCECDFQQAMYQLQNMIEYIN